jgi:uncharacterized protein YkwD
VRGGTLSMLAALLLVLAALLLPAGASAASAKGPVSSCANANLRPSATNMPAIDTATLCLIDRIRAAYHLRSLHLNHELQTVASTQVGDMVHSDYFADNRPSGQTPATLIESTRYAAHATSLATGQNIAWGTGADATPAYVVAAWMRSPAHRELILTADFRDAGVGACAAVPPVVEPVAPAPGATYAVEFGARG